MGRAPAKFSTVDQLRVDRLISHLCHWMDVTREQLIGREQRFRVSAARHILIAVAHEELGLTYAAIKPYLGGRDHGTMIHGVNRLRESKDVRLLADLARARKFARSLITLDRLPEARTA